MTNSSSNLPLESPHLSLVSVELGHLRNEVLDDFSSPLDPTLSGLLEPKYYKHVLACLGSVSFQPLLYCCFLNKIQKQGVGTWEGTIWLSHLYFFIWVSFRLQSVPQLMQTLEAQLISLHLFKVTPHGRPTFPSVATQNSRSGKGTATALYLLIKEMLLSGFRVTRVSQEGSFMGLQAVWLHASTDKKDPTLGLII